MCVLLSHHLSCLPWWDYHHHHQFANLVFNIDVCIILSCTISYFCAVFVSPLDCLVEWYAVGNLILLYDGHWDDQMLCMSYNLLQLLCLHIFAQECPYHVSWLLVITKTMTLDITMPSVVFRLIGHCVANTASGRSMLLWMNPSYQDLFLAMPNQLDLVKGWNNSKWWWVLWHYLRAARFCLLLQPRPVNKLFKLMDACLSALGRTFVFFLKTSPMVCFIFWWISPIPFVAHATQLQFTTLTKGKMLTIKKYSSSKSFPIQWYGNKTWVDLSVPHNLEIFSVQ